MLQLWTTFTCDHSIFIWDYTGCSEMKVTQKKITCLTWWNKNVWSVGSKNAPERNSALREVYIISIIKKDPVCMCICKQEKHSCFLKLFELAVYYLNESWGYEEAIILPNLILHRNGFLNRNLILRLLSFYTTKYIFSKYISFVFWI